MLINFQLQAQNQQIQINYNFTTACNTHQLTSTAVTHQQLDSLVIREPNNENIILNLFKDLQKKEYFQDISIYRGRVVLHETLNLFKWKFTGNTKEILGFTCQEGTTNYRGRDYTAYFTTQLPFKMAPWKFSGLPGIVLEVTSSDGEISIVAQQIKTSKTPIDLTNPFATRKSFDWKGYLKKDKESLEKGAAEIAKLSKGKYTKVSRSCSTNIEVIAY